MNPIETLRADFDLFDDWQERYKYLIDLGNALTPLAPHEQSDQFKVRGCASQVWLVSATENGVMRFRGTSDAHIVRGLIAILLKLYSGQTPDAILALDAEAAFTALGLGAHLTPQRANGFQAMVQRIRKDAEAARGLCKP